MVALPQQFNTADLPDTGGMVLIPAGQYQAVIVESQLVQTKDKNGQFLALKVIITQGQYQGTEFTERLNIINQNPKAVEIAYKTLARISEALGMNRTPNDSNELHNKPLMIEVATEAGNEYTDNQGNKQMGKDKSVIKRYLPMPQAGNAFSAPQAGAPAPQTFAAPPAQQQAQAPAPAPEPQQQAQPAQQPQTATTNPFAQQQQAPQPQQSQAATPPVENPFAPPAS